MRITTVLSLGLAILSFSPGARAEDLTGALLRAELDRNYDAALLAKAMGSPDAEVRRAAARTAGRLKDARAIDGLLRLARDADAPVRRAGLFALGQIGGDAFVIPLRAMLVHMDANDLPFALEALGKSGDVRAVATVVARGPSGGYRYLQHAHAPVRHAAALALFRLGDPSALPELFAVLATASEPDTRWRLVYTAFRLLRTRLRARGAPLVAPPAWAAALRNAAAPERGYVERLFAVRALGGVAGGRELLFPYLGDADPRTVVAALRSLAQPWWAADVERARAATAGHDNALVKEALVDLVAAGGKTAPDETIRMLAALAPAMAGLPREHSKIRVALASLGAPVPAAPAADKDGGAGPREAAAWQVGSYISALPEGLPATVAGRVAAAEVCGEERVPLARARMVLLALLRDPAVTDFAVRATAIGSLAKRKQADAAPDIVAAARAAPGTRDMDVRIEAANALAALEVHDAWLEAACEDPDAPVRAAARDALAKLKRPVPPAKPAAPFDLVGRDAAAVALAARDLEGARVRLTTNRGVIEMMLLPDEAPVHCVNFAMLVRKGFYDGRTWHRVVANFVIQGGCPRGDGWGGPGYAIPDEIGTRPYVRGTVGMPKSGDDTGGCQIFITHLPTPHLDGRYTVYAQVIEGLHVVDAIRVGDRIEKAELVAPER